MAEQLTFDLRPGRSGDVLRFDVAFAVAWRKVERRARQVLRGVMSQAVAPGMRDGFALRRYAEDAALLEALRAQLAGKRLKQAARHSGRMPVKAVVLFAASREGRKLHALVDRVEERLAAREAVTLCG